MEEWDGCLEKPIQQFPGCILKPKSARVINRKGNPFFHFMSHAFEIFSYNNFGLGIMFLKNTI